MRLAGPQIAKIGQARIVLCEIARESNVVQERVEPDERDIVGIERKRDAPG